jgi:hypothetical protein
MIREIFSVIRLEYQRTSQKIQSVKRQFQEHPEKFKEYLNEQDEEQPKEQEQKTESEKAPEEKEEDEHKEEQP